MIDIKLIRNSPDTVKESLKRRFEDPAIVDEILKYDELWRGALKELERLRHERNASSIEIGRRKKQGEDTSEIMAKMKEINRMIAEKQKEVAEYEKKRDYLLMRLPNLLAESVPVCEGDENSPVVRTWGTAKVLKEHVEEFKKFAPNMNYELLSHPAESHVDILEKYDLADIERAGKIAGARFYYLKNHLVILELSLLRFALDKLVAKGYVPVSPPLMIRRAAMDGVTDFTAFEEMIYKIEGEDLYLIATAEHPLVSMHMNEILQRDELPKKYVGVSPCFRKEAGAHGKDTKGIFRVHNFYKVEQVIFSTQEDSWKYFDELIANAEEIYRELGIPYRVIDICSGELGAVAAKKYDIEAWMPAQQKFREIVSCSNCTEYQSRRLKIRYRDG
ncbi:MAG: serine--tRNA ligase, partial [Euryarchaeota archaeon]|nr:serine--tRNA ligase [Euryarchaeota archaeon]